MGLYASAVPESMIKHLELFCQNSGPDILFKEAY
jgi:hypothetical protein